MAFFSISTSPPELISPLTYQPLAMVVYNFERCSFFSFSQFLGRPSYLLNFLHLKNLLSYQKQILKYPCQLTPEKTSFRASFFGLCPFGSCAFVIKSKHQHYFSKQPATTKIAISRRSILIIINQLFKKKTYHKRQGVNQIFRDGLPTQVIQMKLID